MSKTRIPPDLHNRVREWKKLNQITLPQAYREILEAGMSKLGVK